MNERRLTASSIPEEPDGLDGLEEREAEEDDGADFAQVVAGGDVIGVVAGAVDRGDDTDYDGAHERHVERMRVAQGVAGEEASALAACKYISDNRVRKQP